MTAPNENAGFVEQFRAAASDSAELRQFLDRRLGLGGRIEVYQTVVSNPSQQLKNKLAQAASSATDGVLVLKLADAAACNRARTALEEGWAKNHWDHSVACVVLGCPLDDSFEPRCVVRWQSSTPYSLLKAAFPSLEVIDAHGSPAERAGREPLFTLSERLPELFVDETELRTIQSELRRKQNVVLQGPPGVGKTYLARTVAYTLIGAELPERVMQVQFHQSYAYEDFIQGWRPKDGGGFQRQNGLFHEFCQRAAGDTDKRPYVFIVDEINRGNLSKIFGEVLMLIERDKRGPDYAIPLTYSEPGSDEGFFVPANLYLLGMMNTADRSLAVVDYALRRRFSFIALRPRFDHPNFRAHLVRRNVPAPTIDMIVQKLTKLNTEIAADKRHLGPGFEIGHSYFCNPSGDPGDWYRAVVQNEIAPLLREYWFDDSERAEGAIEALLE